MKTKQNTDIHKEDDVCMLAPFYMLQFASFSSRGTDLLKKKNVAQVMSVCMKTILWYFKKLRSSPL